MKEYTIAATVSVVLVVVLDRILRTRLTSRADFWIFIAVMFGFKLVFNGYLTWRPIVLYGERFFLNVRLGTIPLEDFLFGFSMVTLTVVLWEYGRRRFFRELHEGGRPGHRDREILNGETQGKNASPRS
jgi:lycopene cyclase domain-containing protein